ncbi:MAG: hypothetical protein ABI640_19365 [Gammaproteobacteria bacterium]
MPLIALVSAFVLGCAPNEAGPMVEHGEKNVAPAVTSVTTDAWVGRWNSPEGTYLEISGDKGRYEIIVTDLDRARRFQATTVEDHIEFQRDGTNESITPSNGDDTGMKWLAGKTDCLKIRTGEGFCRD